MGDEEENANQKQDVIDYILDRVEQNSRNYNDLVEYLERTDPNFKSNNSTFDDWQRRLDIMRIEEQKERQCAEARRILENEGYLVAKDPNGLDAERVKHWMETGVADDDNIPF